MATAAVVVRPCAACGASQARKKVWEKRGRKVICMACGSGFTFDANGNVKRRGYQPNLTRPVQRPVSVGSLRRSTWDEEQESDWRYRNMGGALLDLSWGY